MAIKLTPPSFQRDAVPTKNGWRHPKTGELLVSNNFSEAQIAEYMGHTAPEPAVEEPVMLAEAMPHKSMDDMNKRELEALGRQHGIELDRRKSKLALVEELHDAGIAE